MSGSSRLKLKYLNILLTNESLSRGTLPSVFPLRLTSSRNNDDLCGDLVVDELINEDGDVVVL